MLRPLGSAALQSAFTLTQLATATRRKYESIVGWAEQALLETEVAIVQGRQARGCDRNCPCVLS